MSYGLQIFNNSGKIMFDTQRVMNSYVLKESGTASSVSNLNPHDIVFLKANSGVTDFVEITGTTMSFLSANPSFSTSKNTLTADYFVISRARDVTTTGDYGFQVFNADQTLQFDSRTILNNNHFQVVEAYGYPEIQSGQDFCTLSQYVSVSIPPNQLNVPSTWTYYDNSSGDTGNYQIEGLRSNTPTSTIKYSGTDVFTEEVDNGQEETNFFLFRINDQVLIGELI